MHKCVKEISPWGRVLWLSDDKVEIGVALDFGIRVVHMSCVGCENLFYVQPEDLSDGFTNAEGWRLYGGHRIWLAPESSASCHPDNDPVKWDETDNGVSITQNIDTLLGVRKTLDIVFREDGGIGLTQCIYNASDKPIDGAAWGVNTLDGGGTATISFTNNGMRGCTPHRLVSLWADTNLHDPRLAFEKEKLIAKYMPLSDYLKLGLYCLDGKAVWENKGQRFTLCFDSLSLSKYPDNGCNFELYMCSKFVELESLGIMTHILPGECANHTETWYLSRV